MSTAAEIKAKKRKTVLILNGVILQEDDPKAAEAASYVIRRIVLRDYASEGVLKIMWDPRISREERAQRVKDHFEAEEPSDKIESENRILAKAVVEPRITLDGEGDSMSVVDLAEDREPLLSAIIEHCGWATKEEIEGKGSSSESADTSSAPSAGSTESGPTSS